MSDNNDNPGRALVPEKTKTSNFPEGLRVLVVDDDVTCLKTLATMLQKCRYQVTQTTKATEALELLRKNADNYDIVITDVIMPDTDGFELLRIIGLEMDVPVIMMSANDDRENVMKSVKQGARDYLVKPVRILELKNIWQHVMRKTVLDPSKSSVMTKGKIMENLALKNQRDISIEKEGGTNTPSDGKSAALKKPRVSRSNELHNKFIDAVQQLDPDRVCSKDVADDESVLQQKAVPQKILEVMKDPQLTREKISSHLQIYRNPLKTKLDSMIKERTSNADPNRLHGGLFNTTSFASSDNKVIPVFRHANDSGEYSRSVDGKIAFLDSVISKHDMINNSLLNERYAYVPPNEQDFLLQQNFHSSRMADQLRPARPISGVENVPSGQAWMANLSRRKMIDGPNVDMSSQISNSGGPIGFTSFRTGQSSPYSFPGLVGRNPSLSEVPAPGRVQSLCPPDQVQGARPISIVQKVALRPAWMTNPSRKKMIDGHYMDTSSQISNFSTGKSGAPVGYNSFGTGQACAPIGFTSFGTGQSGTSFPGFLGRQPGPCEVPRPGLVPFDSSTQLTSTSQPNSLPGQHEARGFAAFSGRVGSAYRGLLTGCQAIDKLPVTGQGTFMQLVTDDLKQEDKGLLSSYSSTDDELSVLLKQFGKNSAPTL